MKRILSVVVLGALMVPGFSGALAAEARIDDFNFECRAPDGKRLKPKHGDIDGVFFVDLPAQRQECLDSVDRRIAWCRDNTVFTSNTLNNKYPDCLPIFEEQAQSCVAFFRDERRKCDGGGGSSGKEQAAGSALEGVGTRGLKSSGDRYVCVESGDSSATHTWKGRCAGGVPVGEGAIEIGKARHSVSFVEGRLNGHAVLRFAKGDVQEGPFVDGKRNGRWVMRFANGDVQEGPFVDGKRNGRWVERFADGDVEEGPYVDGKRNGRWVLRWPGLGAVLEGPFVDGKENGRWVTRWGDGEVTEGSYVDGKKTGRWRTTRPDGTTAQENNY